MRIRHAVLALSLMFLAVITATAGGPLYVGGYFGPTGKPFTWDNTKPIKYWVDGGTLGKLTHDEAVQRVQSAFEAWSSIPTASLTVQNAGAIPATAGFTDGDVSTAAEFDAVWNACTDTNNPNPPSPIIFDADAQILQELGADSDVLGFDSACQWSSDGRYVSSMVLLGGGVYDGSGKDVTSDELDAFIEHEFGHFLGLDHSQIAIQLISGGWVNEDLQGLPTMFPYLMTGTGGAQKSLSEDDIAWISYMYPVLAPATGKTLFSSVYGVISGDVLFGDDKSRAQGVNVIARKNVNGTPSRSLAYSCPSGYLFTGNPGQSVSGTNISDWNGLPGSYLGSRDPLLIGRYEIPVRAGAYSLEIESIDWEFVDGSSVGPLGQSPPYGRGVQIPMPAPAASANPSVTVAAGAVSTGNNITMQPSDPRFDQYESQ